VTVMKTSLIPAVLLLGTSLLVGQVARADDLSNCKTSDHYTNLDTDYKSCVNALLLPNLDDKTKAGLLFARAEIVFYAERFELALPDLNEAIRLNPNLRDAHYRRARTYIELNQYGDAMDELTSLIEKDANDAEAIYAIGLIYEMASEDDKEAIKYFEAALKLTPNYPMARFHLARLQVKDAALRQDALLNFKSVLNSPAADIAKVRMIPRPNGTTVLEFRDLVLVNYLTAKQNDTTVLESVDVELMEDSIKRNPQSFEPAIVRSKYYHSQKKYDAALSEARRAYAISYGNPDAAEKVLESLDSLKRWQEALDFVNDVLNTSGRNIRPSFFLDHRALYEEKLGKYAEALSDYEATLQMSSDYLPGIINNLIEHQYYEGTLSDSYNEKIRDGIKACIIDPECLNVSN
jgi:tetratricopeptide (TPR) repeat protein